MNTKRILVFFNAIGITPNLKGYPYLVYLVGLAADAYASEIPKMTELYARTGEHFGVSAEMVSNNIRTVLRKYWDQSNSPLFFQYTRYSGEKHLPVKEFVSVAAGYLALHS